MHTVLVNIRVKMDSIDEFIQATKENVRNSLDEPGIIQFDFLQKRDEPDRFMIYEVYQSADDQLKHRETRHYQVWKDEVASMMAAPREGWIFNKITTEPWEKS